MNDTENLPKPEVIRLLLELEGRIMLCLDATFKGVEVPRRFAEDPGLRLILNRQMPQPIDIGAESVQSELRFGGIPHACSIPYDALWGVFNPDTGHGMFWPESMPEIIRNNFDMSQSLAFNNMPPMPVDGAAPPETKGEVSQLPPPAEIRKKPVFSVIEGAGKGESPAKDASGSGGKKKKGPPHLQVVK